MHARLHSNTQVPKSTVMEEECVVEGYTVDEDGGIVRTARLAEDSEETGEHNAETTIAVPTAGLGHGHRSKIGSKKYGAEWEEH